MIFITLPLTLCFERPLFPIADLIDKKVEILNFLKENKDNWYTLEDLSSGISIPQCAGIMTSLIKENWVEWKRNNGEKYYSWKERD